MLNIICTKEKIEIISEYRTFYTISKKDTNDKIDRNFQISDNKTIEGRCREIQEMVKKCVKEEDVDWFVILVSNKYEVSHLIILIKPEFLKSYIDRLLKESKDWISEKKIEEQIGNDVSNQYNGRGVSRINDNVKKQIEEVLDEWKEMKKIEFKQDGPNIENKKYRLK